MALQSEFKIKFNNKKINIIGGMDISACSENPSIGIVSYTIMDISTLNVFFINFLAKF